MPRGSAPGERRGGREAGTPNRRTSALREAIEAEGVDPAIALVRIGKAAEARAEAVTELLNEVIAKAAEAGAVTEDADLEIARRLSEARAELSLAAECYGKVLPFVHAKPRTSADAHPEEALEFAKAMLAAKVDAAADAIANNRGLNGLAERLDRAKARVEIHVNTGIDRAPDDVSVTLSAPAPDLGQVIDAKPVQPAPAPSAGPAPVRATEPPPAPAPAPPAPYVPLARRVDPPPDAAADWASPAAPAAPWPERASFADTDYDPTNGSYKLP